MVKAIVRVNLLTDLNGTETLLSPGDIIDVSVKKFKSLGTSVKRYIEPVASISDLELSESDDQADEIIAVKAEKPDSPNVKATATKKVK